MADPRDGTRGARLVMTFTAVAATLGGWLALARTEPNPPSPSEPGVAALPPLPSLDLPKAPPPAARWPAPIATTRASR